MRWFGHMAMYGAMYRGMKKAKKIGAFNHHMHHHGDALKVKIPSDGGGEKGGHDIFHHLIF